MKPHIENDTNKVATLENILKLAPGFTAAILVISITYDSAYLWALGLSLGDIPSSISEHIRSAILWSPIVFILILIFGSIFLLGDTSTDPKKIESDDPIAEALFGARGTILSIAALLLLCYVIYETRSYMYVFLAFPAIWMQILTRFASLRARKNLPISMQLRYFLILPIVLSVVGFSGYFLGNRLLNSNKLQWEYTVKKEDKEIVFNTFGQRRFTEFTIAVTESKKILIIPNSNILSTKSL
jgi:carbon starvation protein CstA